MEDEIDLRQYVGIVRRHWLVICAITAVAVIAAVVLSLLSEPVYTAKSTVILNPSSCVLSFKPEQGEASASISRVALNEKTCIALAKSTAVAQAVIDELGDQLSPQEQEARTLANAVSVSSDGGVVDISAKSSDSDKAISIANAWADSYAEYLSDYAATLGGDLDDVRTLSEQVLAAYEEQKASFLQFQATSQVDALQRRIADMESLCDLKSLRAHVETGSLSAASTAGHGLALMLIQTEAFAASSDSVQLTLDGSLIPAATPEELLHDIDTLISALELRAGIQPGLTVAELSQRLAVLQSEVAAEQRTGQELQDAMDAGWGLYQAIQTAIQETEVTSAVQGPPAQVVGQAKTASDGTGLNKMNIAIGLVLGLIVGVLAAFGLEYFKSPPKEAKVEGGDQPPTQGTEEG